MSRRVRLFRRHLHEKKADTLQSIMHHQAIRTSKRGSHSLPIKAAKAERIATALHRTHTR